MVSGLLLLTIPFESLTQWWSPVRIWRFVTTGRIKVILTVVVRYLEGKIRKVRCNMKDDRKILVIDFVK